MAVKNYKLLLLVPCVLLVLAIAVLAAGYMENGEWFRRSIELRGGTLVTLNSESGMEAADLQSILEQALGEVSVKKISGGSGEGYVIQADSAIDAQDILDATEQAGIVAAEYSAQTIGPALGASFWSQAQLAIVFAFVMMGIIVFAIFRTGVPSGAMILCAVSDIVITIAAMQVFGIELSLAGLAALLMLIGYSVDTDIMLTTRLLRGTGEFKERFSFSLKTGLTMSVTTIGALIALLVAGVSAVLSQIAVVLLIGLVTDVAFTWLQNSVLLRWYMEARGLV